MHDVCIMLHMPCFWNRAYCTLRDPWGKPGYDRCTSTHSLSTIAIMLSDPEAAALYWKSPPIVIRQGKYNTIGYADQAATSAHCSDKGFTANESACSTVVEGLLRYILGHGMLQMASFVRYVVQTGSPSCHIPDIPHTSCSHLMSVYLHPFENHTVRQCMTAHAKPEPA